MSSTLGVSARSARDLALQGIYQYSFDDLPEDIVAAIELHFRLALADLRSRVDSLLTNVTKPTITVFRPAKDKDNGAAVLIFPGGGYWNLAWDLEGEEVAAWLNSLGATGIVVKYRVPRRPGQPVAFGKIGNAYLFGLPGNPVAVMVTFYQFVRDALLHLSGRTDDFSLPLLKATTGEALRKVPGRTEYQRGVLFKENAEWKVRTTGQQGSGVLRSMSEANCFIVLEHERGAVKAGERVAVQLFEGLT